jgi:protein-disulfide isomerase
MQRKAEVVVALVAGLAALALIGSATRHSSRHASSPAGSAPGSARPSTAPESQAAPSSSSGYIRDTAVWKVPVTPDDPVKGNADALVTIVAFSELESPFCKKAADTLEQVLTAYPNDVRLVWKDAPLPFDVHARPAAVFGRAVYGALGNQGFWRAQSLLFGSPQLETSDLEGISHALGLPAGIAKEASEDARLARKIDESLALGFDVQAKGIPHLFVNGVRLAGAQPLDKVTHLVDEQLTKARVLVASGVPRHEVYETIIGAGKQLPKLNTHEAPLPPASSLSIGAPDAKVVVQFWSRFPCVPCIGAIEQLQSLETEYHGRIRVVFRLQGATPIFEATHEAFAQQGVSGLKAWHDRFADGAASPADEAERSTRAALETFAKASRLDLGRFQAALDSHRYQKAVRTDAEAASKSAISAPAFFVNGYYFAGAQPSFALRRAVQHAINDVHAD